MTRPIVKIIDLSALRQNALAAKKMAGQAKVWAVVKADAYGHGLFRTAKALENIVDGLALIEIDSAIRLREEGWQKEILMLQGFYDAADLTAFIQHHIQFAVHDNEQIEVIEAVCQRLPEDSTFDLYLKMNTGMNRLGFKPENYAKAYHRLKKLPQVRQIGMMTHFANADDANNSVLPFAEQVKRFKAGSAGLEGNHCIANSAAILEFPEVDFEWVRAGIMLYGATPGIKSAKDFHLIPAMSLESKLISIQEINPGDAVGYGSQFVADKPMRVAVVACGYADGYPRVAPTGTPIIVDGVKTRTVGRVSMDMLGVDVTDIPSARVGSHVELWGKNLPVDEVAEAAGTIGYELLCAVAPRVPVQEKE